MEDYRSAFSSYKTPANENLVRRVHIDHLADMDITVLVQINLIMKEWH